MQLEFHKENYDSVLLYLKDNRSLWKELSSIVLLDKVNLKICGDNNNLDNFQIFTPRFVVDDMLKAIGIQNITNNKYTILEPTSGDGAFTCRIFELRLKQNTIKTSQNIFECLLDSLSTIYSIEMDKKLIEEQRNNIYTIAIQFLKKRKRTLSESEDAVLRLLIYSNFLWAETNIYQTPTLLVCDVAYKMPEAEKKEYLSIQFPVWNFAENKVSLHYELPEVGY